MTVQIKDAVTGAAQTVKVPDEVAAAIVAAINALLTGTQPISATALPLPNGAATQATLAALLAALGSPAQAGGNVAVMASALPAGAATAAGVAAVVTALAALLTVDTVVKATAAPRGASVGTTASTLMAANTARRGFAIQNQSSTAKIYINGSATATADFNSLMIGPGQYYETPNGHTGTGAVSIISDTATTSVYAREW